MIDPLTLSPLLNRREEQIGRIDGDMRAKQGTITVVRTRFEEREVKVVKVEPYGFGLLERLAELAES